jgi:PAS domain S-box-containing protein
MRKSFYLIRCAAAAALWLLLFSGPSWAVHHVRVGFYQNEPLVFRDGDGTVRGIYADVLDAVALENDWTMEWVEGTFAEGLERLERREIDIMAAVAWTEERNQLFDFNRLAVVSNWGVFYSRRDMIPVSILSLDGMKLAVVKRDTYGEAFKALAERFGITCSYLEVDNYSDVFKAIQEWKAEAGLVSRLFGLTNEGDFRVERTNIFLEPRELRFAAPKGASVTVLQILDFHLAQWRLSPNSPLNRSIQSWLSERSVLSVIPRWFPCFVGISLAVVAGVLFTNLRLRRKVMVGTRALLKSKADLSREKVLFEKLFDESPDALVLQRAGDNKILRVNRGFTRLFGFTREEGEGNTLNELVVPKNLQHEGLELDGTTGSGNPIHLETVRRKKDGGLVDVSLISVPVTLEEGVVGAYVIYRDISDAKETRSVLVESRERIRKSLESMKRAWEQTIDVLAMAAETRDPYTAGHQRNVSALSEAIGVEMGLDEGTVNSLRMAGLVHDVGKINIPAEILSKPGTLGEVELALIRTHPEVGYDIMKNIEFPWRLADMILQHHERMDGSGYPAGLKGEEILLESRILAVADVVEAMSSHRPYRASLGVEAALEEIEANRGRLYDPLVVEACLRLFREKNFRFPGP